MLDNDKHYGKNKKYNRFRRIERTVEQGGLPFNSIENSFGQEFKEVRKTAIEISGGRTFEVEGTSDQNVLCKNAIVVEEVT